LDQLLLKTFLEVSDTGSFGAAAGRLFVTQSAVSLRVQRLEDQLGRPLFDRNKAGVTMTAAGREFRGFALLLLRNWDQARQSVSALEDAAVTLAVAAEPALWPHLGLGWLDLLREALPDIALRADVAHADALTDLVMSGSVQAVLTYSCLVRPGLTAEPLMHDQLVMVGSWKDATLESVVGRYAKVDWGEDFRRAHDASLPALAGQKMSFAMGTLASGFLKIRPYAAYLPASHVRQPLADGDLFLVSDAPIFAQPVWVAWRDDLDPELRAVAGKTLSTAVSAAEKDVAFIVGQ